MNSIQTFLNFLLCFKNYIRFSTFLKKLPLRAHVFAKYETAKEVVKKTSKKTLSKHSSPVNMLKAPKQC